MISHSRTLHGRPFRDDPRCKPVMPHSGDCRSRWFPSCASPKSMNTATVPVCAPGRPCAACLLELLYNRTSNRPRARSSAHPAPCSVFWRSRRSSPRVLSPIWIRCSPARSSRASRRPARRLAPCRAAARPLRDRAVSRRPACVHSSKRGSSLIVRYLGAAAADAVLGCEPEHWPVQQLDWCATVRVPSYA